MLTYNKETRQFERDGVIITAAMLLALVDRLTEYARKAARRLGRQLEAGTISPEEFASQMTRLLTASHITAATLGGRVDMPAIRRKVEWQRGYLTKFVKGVAAGAIITGIASRAASYISAIYPTFANARFEERKEVDKQVLCRLVTNSQEGCGECAADEAQGWMPVDDMGEIGSRECGDFCKCEILFSDEL